MLLIQFLKVKLIVVTGGLNYVLEKLSSVEAYDYYENKWSYLPDINE